MLLTTVEHKDEEEYFSSSIAMIQNTQKSLMNYTAYLVKKILSLKITHMTNIFLKLVYSVVSFLLNLHLTKVVSFQRYYHHLIVKMKISIFLMSQITL